MQILGLVVRRALTVIPILIGVAVITFFIVRSVPGDPARVIAGPYATAETVENIRQQWHLDDPLHVQLFGYLGRLLQGDLGVSIQSRNPVLEDILDRLPATLELAIVALILMVIMGVTLGVIAAANRGRFADHVARFVVVLGGAMPAFWLALVLQLFFFQRLHWLPAVGRTTSAATAPDHVTGFYLIDSIITLNGPALADTVLHLILPAVTLALAGVAGICRIARSSMLEVLEKDYIRSAQARGIPWRTVVGSHALRNALLPTITVVGLLFGSMLGGALVVEWIFGWPGIGTYAANSITNLDYSAIIGVTVTFAVAYLIVNLLVDIAYLIFNPILKAR